MRDSAPPSSCKRPTEPGCPETASVARSTITCNYFSITCCVSIRSEGLEIGVELQCRDKEWQPYAAYNCQAVQVDELRASARWTTAPHICRSPIVRKSSHMPLGGAPSDNSLIGPTAMKPEVSIFVDYVDPIGGVTTWSRQVAHNLSGAHKVSLVAVNNEPARQPHADLFLPAEQCEVVQTGRALPPNHYAEFDVGSWHELHCSAQTIIARTSLYVPNYFEYAFRLAAIARLRGSLSPRCIGMCHTDEEYYYYLLTKYAPIINTFVSVSTKCTRELSKRLPDWHDDIVELRYGVNIPSSWRKPNPSKPLRLLYIGRLLQRQKRIFDFIALVRELRRRGIDFTLDFVGAGENKKALLDSMSPFADRVRFQDPVSPFAVDQVYTNHDVLILTSATEGTSIAMLEAMAFGVVPVATEVSGAEDIIVDGRNGFLYPVGDIRRAADCVAVLAQDSGRWQLMSRAAQECAKRNFSIESHVQALRACLDQTYRKSPASSEAAQKVLADPRTLDLPA